MGSGNQFYRRLGASEEDPLLLYMSSWNICKTVIFLYTDMSVLYVVASVLLKDLRQPGSVTMRITLTHTHTHGSQRPAWECLP